MKKFAIQSVLSLLVLGALSLASCKKDNCNQTVTYKTYAPVYMSYADLRKAVTSQVAQPLKTPGKIYLRGNYIFVNEVDKGIHVIDNTNPSSPQNIAFINIPGNLDLAVIGNVLYADSYIDLLALDISNPGHVTVLSRIQNMIPPRVYYTYGYNVDTSKGVVVDWTPTTVTDKVSSDCKTGQLLYPGGIFYEQTGGGPVYNSTNTTPSGTGTSVTAPTPGMGGSTARLTIAGNALYIVDNSNLNIYDISNNSKPAKVSVQNVGWSIETIFPYKNHLFIGSSSGVYIYDNTNVLNPVFVSVYSHMTACDPVVVDDQYAYFTLSNDAPCHMGVNQLEVVDISDITKPTLKTTVAMTDPKGLGIDAKKLFICDNNDGLRVYNTSDIMNIQNNQLAHFVNINASDVIPFNNKLLMTGTDGLYQYDYSDVQNIRLLSRIAVEK